MTEISKSRRYAISKKALQLFQKSELHGQVSNTLMENYGYVNDDLIWSLICKVSNMTHGAKERNALTGSPPPDFDVMYMLQLYVEQNGKCYYNEWISLNVEFLDHRNMCGHSISMERLDPTKCYSRENVRFVVAILSKNPLGDLFK